MPTPRRGYKVAGKKVPSVTTILGDDVGGLLWWAENGAALATEEVGGDAETGFAEWRSRKKDTMDAGTYCHWLIENYLGQVTEEPDVSLIARQRGEIAFGHWQVWWASVGPTVDVLHIEERVTSPTLHYGGTPDLVVRGESGVWVCDWKTSEKPKLRAKSIAQCAGYMHAVCETFGYTDPGGLRVVGLPTVSEGGPIDWAAPWSGPGEAALAAFSARRVSFEAWKSLEKLTKEIG